VLIPANRFLWDEWRLALAWGRGTPLSTSSTARYSYARSDFTGQIGQLTEYHHGNGWLPLGRSNITSLILSFGSRWLSIMSSSFTYFELWRPQRPAQSGIGSG
jgi:hypothetical protein